MKPCPRIALVGVTGYGHVHFNHLRALAGQGLCDFAAAAVVNPEHPDAAEPLEWLRSRGAAVYPTAEDLFAAEAGRLDLVTLPVGISAHEPLVKAALAAGANVLVEKPAAGCTAAVDRMIAAERAAAPLRVFVGFQHVSAPEVRDIKRTIASGALGKPRSIVVTGIWPRNDAYYARNTWAARQTAPDGTPIRDSPANNAFAHYLNLALLFASTDPALPARPLSAEGALWRARPGIETFDTCMVRFAADSGAEIALCLSHAAKTSENPRIRVDCERGTVLWTHEGPWEIRDSGGAILSQGVAEPPHKAMFKAALNAVSEGASLCAVASAENAPERVTPCLCTLPMARAQVEAIEVMSETLSVTSLSESATCLPGGQWVIDGVSEAFAGVLATGLLKLPDWK